MVSEIRVPSSSSSSSGEASVSKTMGKSRSCKPNFNETQLTDGDGLNAHTLLEMGIRCVVGIFGV